MIQAIYNQKELYAWQKDFIKTKGNEKRVLLCAEAGTGKTIASIHWLKLQDYARALIIAPKGIQKKWREDLKEWQMEDVDVITNDGIKKQDLFPYTAIIVDE